MVALQYFSSVADEIRNAATVARLDRSVRDCLDNPGRRPLVMHWQLAPDGRLAPHWDVAITPATRCSRTEYQS